MGRRAFLFQWAPFKLHVRFRWCWAFKREHFAFGPWESRLRIGPLTILRRWKWWTPSPPPPDHPNCRCILVDPRAKDLVEELKKYNWVPDPTIKGGISPPWYSQGEKDILEAFRLKYLDGWPPKDAKNRD